jgi:predicted helicase
MPYNKYYKTIKNLKNFASNESSIRDAFFTLIKDQLPSNYTLILEKILKNGKRPDGTILDSNGIPFGFIENKDAKDNLNEEIVSKSKLEYPTSNIIYENSQQLVLIQDGNMVANIAMDNQEDLKKAIDKFIKYESIVTKDYNAELKNFMDNLPYVIEKLNVLISTQYDVNMDFKNKLAIFLKDMQDSINPSIVKTDIFEIMIQHILTNDIFCKIFNAYNFMNQNNVAKNISQLIDCLAKNDLNATIKDMQKLYTKIATIAISLNSYKEKQVFLKVFYQKFYNAYNPNKADVLGIVYTPNEVVDFIINTTDQLCQKYFNKALDEKGVDILDPCTGTGVFITNLLDFMKHSPNLIYKYNEEIHCNEIDILPYYIANLNIENVYYEILEQKNKQAEHKSFENICLVDTLDNIDKTTNTTLLYNLSNSSENMERIKKQQSKKISIIMGNPPYNANQKNENNNNKNKKYAEVDLRIKQTYVHFSEAQKTSQYDMYKRFVRWASDRIENEGIVAFVTSGSFVDSKQDDGFRKIIAQEFDHIYVYDLKGKPQNRGGEAKDGNIFGIMLPVAIMFLVKKQAKLSPNNALNNNLNNSNGNSQNQAQIFYYDAPIASKDDKLSHLNSFTNQALLKYMPFYPITPALNGQWINKNTTDFEDNTPIVDKKVKQNALLNPMAEQVLNAKTIFKIFSIGVVSARDDWVYDNNKQNLANKINAFINIYNQQVEKHKNITFKNHEQYGDKELSNALNYDIKWSSSLKNYLQRKIIFEYDGQKIIKSMYRPFVEKYLYYDDKVLERQREFNKIFPNPNVDNLCININNTDRVPFSPFITNKMINYSPLVASASTAIPLNYYMEKDGKLTKYGNITDWALKYFKNHYQNENITDLDIFYYCYGVLNNPNYQNKYLNNLKTSYPTIPLYKNFNLYKQQGEQLANLHLNVNSLQPYENINIEDNLKELNNLELKFKIIGNNTIFLHQDISIGNIPQEAFEYKLGGKAVIKHVLDGYANRKLSLKEQHEAYLINNNLNYYNPVQTKDFLLSYLPKIITMCVNTHKIHQDMLKQEE